DSAREPLVELRLDLDADGVRDAGERRERADGEREIDQLSRLVVSSERFPSRVADESVDVQLVGRAEPGSLEGIPAGRVGPAGDTLEVLRAQPIRERCGRTMRP